MEPQGRLWLETNTITAAIEDTTSALIPLLQTVQERPCGPGSAATSLLGEMGN